MMAHRTCALLARDLGFAAEENMVEFLTKKIEELVNLKEPGKIASRFKSRKGGGVSNQSML
jgi:hypothetical protein